MKFIFAILLISCVSKNTFCEGETVYVRLPYGDTPSIAHSAEYCAAGVQSSYVSESIIVIHCKCKDNE